MPDGNSLMMFGRDLNGRSGIYRVDAKTGGTSLVTESLTTGINVSPDGKKIYYNVDKFGPSGRPGKYIERDLASGTVRVVFQDPFWGPKLSPDGRYLTRVFTEKGDSVIRLVPVSGGEESELFRVPGVQGAFGHGVCWTPDGRALVTAGDAGVLVIPVDGGEIRKLDVDFGPFGGVTVSPDGKHVATNTGKSLREIWALENFLPTQTASNK
jgi:Tol biopolymer transport system component